MRSVLFFIHRILSKQSKKSIILLALMMIAFLGWLDYWSGDEIALSFFYLASIFVSTWYVSLSSGYALTLISITLWVLSNKLAGETYTYEIIRYWNALIRLLFFGFTAFLLNTLKRALSDAQLLAQTDPLTGVYNRRAFYRLAEMEIFRSQRYAHPLTVVYFDIDNFKTINDRLGHLIGDTLLCDFTRVLGPNLRKTDILARLGGDEFVILFPEMEQGNVRSVIHKLQVVFSEQWRWENSGQTISIGVVTFMSAPATVDEMLAKADHAMYEAKSLGKNQVIFRTA